MRFVALYKGNIEDALPVDYYKGKNTILTLVFM